jgi:hypothetical protein
VLLEVWLPGRLGQPCSRGDQYGCDPQNPYHASASILFSSGAGPNRTLELCQPLAFDIDPDARAPGIEREQRN